MHLDVPTALALIVVRLLPIVARRVGLHIAVGTDALHSCPFGRPSGEFAMAAADFLGAVESSRSIGVEIQLSVYSSSVARQDKLSTPSFLQEDSELILE